MIAGSSNFFGVDVGGTTTRIGVIDANGRLLHVHRFETLRSAELLLDSLVAAIETLSSECAGERVEPDSIGLALPGPIDRDRGVLVRCVNLPFLEGVPIAQLVQRRTGCRVVLCTDADAATWGEFTACPSRPQRFIHLRLGTGIACGIVIHDKLQPTGAGRKTHWEQLVVDHRANAPLCACGLRGCLELFASGPAIERRARDLGLPFELSALQSSPVSGAKELSDEVAGWIVRAIGGVVDPLPDGRGSELRGDAVVVSIGGGVVAGLPRLFDAVLAQWPRKRLTAAAGRSVEIVPARLGDDAGVIGAALLSQRS